LRFFSRYRVQRGTHVWFQGHQHEEEVIQAMCAGRCSQRGVAHDLLGYGVFRTNYSCTLLYCLLIDLQQSEMHAYIQF